jgi:VanZ family protein
MTYKLTAIAAWTVLGFIAYVTLSPLSFRPIVADSNSERFFAYALTGLLLALAYPRRLLFVVSFVVIGASVLEILQLATPDRHARIADTLVKIAGGVAGILVACFLTICARFRTRF